MTRRVLIRCNQSMLLEKARSLLANVHAETAFTIGDIDEEKLAELGALESVRYQLLPVKKAAPRSARPTVPAADGSYKVELLQPLTADCRAELARRRITLLRRLPAGDDGRPAGEDLEMRPQVYAARLTGAQVVVLTALPFIGEVTPLDETEKVPPGMLAGRGARGAAGRESMEAGEYEILLNRAGDLGEVLAWLRELRQVTVRVSLGRKILADLPADSVLLAALASLPAVEQVERALPPELHGDHARRLLGIDATPVVPGPSFTLPQRGRGQRVGVADTGIDHGHPDFGARVVGLIARGRPGNTSDPNGHGTHVAGCIAGDGTASGGLVCGTAPEAELVVQSLLDSAGKVTGGLPDDLQDLFAEAYRQGVRIHNNSWGVAAQSRYRAQSDEFDRFVADHRDMLIVCSAGNYGSARTSRYVQSGYVDWYSLGAPATNKNGLTVGACRTDRTGGPSAGVAHGTRWGTDFPANPIAGEFIAGDAESLVGQSGRGPAYPHRLKPDVVAPGSDILAALSRSAGSFGGTYPPGNYAYASGTSMAAPLVAGCAALVREYYVALPDIDAGPSAALLKATLINGTRWLTGHDAIEHHPQAGNMHQGFGRVDMSRTIPNPAFPDLELAYFDPWTRLADQLSETGDQHRFDFELAADGCLRLCLAHTDRPGNGVQSRINLSLELPDGTRRTGNDHCFHGDPRRLRQIAADEENNVEIIRLDTAKKGRYTVYVDANDLLDCPHDYALVITGALAPGGTGCLQRS